MLTGLMRLSFDYHFAPDAMAALSTRSIMADAALFCCFISMRSRQPMPPRWRFDAMRWLRQALLRRACRHFVYASHFGSSMIEDY